MSPKLCFKLGSLLSFLFLHPSESQDLPLRHPRVSMAVSQPASRANSSIAESLNPLTAASPPLRLPLTPDRYLDTAVRDQSAVRIPLGCVLQIGLLHDAYPRT